MTADSLPATVIIRWHIEWPDWANDLGEQWNYDYQDVPRAGDGWRIIDMGLPQGKKIGSQESPATDADIRRYAAARLADHLSDPDYYALTMGTARIVVWHKVEYGHDTEWWAADPILILTSDDTGAREALDPITLLEAEEPEIAAILRHISASTGQTIARQIRQQGPLGVALALSAVATLGREVEVLTGMLARRAAAGGMSWQDIAVRCGLASRQTAHARYAKDSD